MGKIKKHPLSASFNEIVSQGNIIIKSNNNNLNNQWKILQTILFLCNQQNHMPNIII